MNTDLETKQGDTTIKTLKEFKLDKLRKIINIIIGFELIVLLLPPGFIMLQETAGKTWQKKIERTKSSSDIVKAAMAATMAIDIRLFPVVKLTVGVGAWEKAGGMLD